MPSQMSPMAIASIIVLVAYFIGSEWFRRHTYSKFNRTFQQGDFEECLRQLDGVPLRITQTRYNQLMMRFNVYLAMDDNDKAQDMIDLVFKQKLNKNQRKVALLRGFNFFVERGQNKRAKQVLDELEGAGVEPAVIADCQQTYDILCARRYDYIEDMEAKLDSVRPEERLRLYFLLSEQYENKGSQGKAREYRQLATEGMERMINRAATDAETAEEARRAAAGQGSEGDQKAAQDQARKKLEAMKRLDRTKR